ncbi:MAG: hypothetical protein ACOC56_05295 [Atribacterota bacterium]
MIVFLDVKKRIIEIYSDNGKKTYPFCEIELIKDSLEENNIFYVTNAIITNKNKILTVLQSFMKNAPAQNSKGVYMRSTLKGSFSIPSVGLDFQDSSDCIPIETIYEKCGKEILQNSVIKHLIQQGKLQIVTYEDFLAINKQFAEQEKEKQKKEDENLNKIIVDGSVENYLESYQEEAGTTNKRDAIEINIEKVLGSGKPRSKDSNEGRLLPEYM